MANTPQDTGKNQAAAARETAGRVGDIALDLAQGATAFQAATNALKGAALDKLLGPTAVFAGGLVGVLTVMRKIVRESQLLEKGLGNVARLQQVQGKFETLLKSATLAKQRIEELYRFAARSPFKFEDVAEANRILQALTRGAFSGAEAMKLVGDTAAATGQSLSETAEKVGKLYAALSSGRSIDKVAFQLQFTGLATEGLIGKLESLEKSGAGFAEQWNEVTKVLGANEGGMKNEMRSLDALRTKLDEASTLMATAFAEPFTDAQAKSIEVMTKATQNLTPVLRAVGGDLAVISGLVTDFKTGVVENTLASSGMAKALRGAWEVGKGLFVTLSAIAAVNALRGTGPALAFMGKSLGTAKDSLRGSMTSPGAAAARTAAGAAAEALSAGNFAAAASEGAVAARFHVTARAAAVKAAAVQAAAGASGLAAVRNGALAASTVVAAGAVSLLGRVAVAAGAAVKGAFAAAFATPLGLFVTGLYSAVTAHLALADASKRAADGLAEVTAGTADLHRELQRTEDAFQTTDDWAAYFTKITEEIAKAEQSAARFKQTLGERGAVERALDFVSGADRDYSRTGRALDDNVANLRARRSGSLRFLPTLGMGEREAEAFARDLRNANDSGDSAFQNALSLADDRAAVALMDEEISKLKHMTAETLRVRDAQEKFNRSREKAEADGALLGAVAARTAAEQAARAGGVSIGAGQTIAGRLAELQGRRAELAARLASEQAGARAGAAGGAGVGAGGAATQEALAALARQIGLLERVAETTAEAESAERTLAAMRRESSSELIRNSQRLADLRREASGGDAVRAEIQDLEKRNLALLEAVRIVDDEVRRTQQLEFERAQRAEAADLLGTVVLPFDRQINAATARGDAPEAARLSVLKEITVIEKQIAQERARGNSAQRIAQLETERAAVQARELARLREFQTARAFDRRANQAEAGGDSRGAQAFRDAQALAELKLAYRAGGLSEGQAASDFALGLRAGAAAGSRIVADSISTVGGGGGVYGGGNGPAAEAGRRAVAAAEAAVAVQKQILAALQTSSGPVLK